MNKPSIFDTIRLRCSQVADQARFVHIVPEQIRKTVTTLLDKSLTLPTLDTASHFVGDVEPTIAFFMSLASINFGSGYFPHLRKRPGMSGYYTIASALAERFYAQGPYTALRLSQLSPSDCAMLLGQDQSNPTIAELMALFARAWNDLGKDLITRFNGSFSKCIETADHRASGLVSILAEQPLFRDVSCYHGIDVPFYKRSQLLSSDLSLALEGQGLGHFEDLDELTIFADNLVPHVLRLEGILQYEPALLDRIELEQVIPAGSDEEIEIRACSIHAVELMIDAAAEGGVRWTARDVDQVLWHQGQQPRYKKQNKRHRTRTAFY